MFHRVVLLGILKANPPCLAKQHILSRLVILTRSVSQKKPNGSSNQFKDLFWKIDWGIELNYLWIKSLNQRFTHTLSPDCFIRNRSNTTLLSRLSNTCRNDMNLWCWHTCWHMQSISFLAIAQGEGSWIA